MIILPTSADHTFPAPANTPLGVDAEAAAGGVPGTRPTLAKDTSISDLGSGLEPGGLTGPLPLLDPRVIVHPGMDGLQRVSGPAPSASGPSRPRRETKPTRRAAGLDGCVHRDSPYDPI